MSLKAVALETLEIVGRGRYTTPSGATVDFSGAQEAAVTGTFAVSPEGARVLRERVSTGPIPKPEVRGASTQVAALDLAPDVAVLNFASARNPGGGFLNGAKAQEEDLCRCSGLYPCLAPQMATYYLPNRRWPDALYTDAMIYSPAVPFFRTSGRGALLEMPFLADVITAPAPNRGALPGVPERVLRQTLEARWAGVLGLARSRGRRSLLLGAWGCGAFQNDPEMAAEAFLTVLPRFGGAFDRLVFAIPDTGNRSAANHAAFSRVLAS